MDTKTKKQRRKTVFEQENGTILPMCLCPTIKALNIVTPHASHLFAPSRATGSPRHSQGQYNPVPGLRLIETVFYSGAGWPGFWSKVT